MSALAKFPQIAQCANSGADNLNNCAFCDKSVKFGTHIAKDFPKECRYLQLIFNMAAVAAIIQDGRRCKSFQINFLLLWDII